MTDKEPFTLEEVCALTNAIRAAEHIDVLSAQLLRNQMVATNKAGELVHPEEGPTFHPEEYFARAMAYLEASAREVLPVLELFRAKVPAAAQSADWLYEQMPELKGEYFKDANAE